MPFSIVQNLKKLKRAEKPSPPLFPLSLSLPLPIPEIVPSSILASLSSTRATIKPYNFGSTDSGLLKVFAAGAVIVTVIFTRQLLSWWSQKKHVFIMLWSNVTRLITARIHTTQFLGGKGISKNGGWGNLPEELCEYIGKRIKSRLGILRFRSVCKQWRSSLPYPNRFPLFVPPPPGCGDSVYPTIPYCITQVDFYRRVYGYGYGCVALAFEEVDKGGKLHVHSLEARDFKVHSSMIPLTSHKHPLSCLSFHSKAYYIRKVLPHFDSDNNWVQGRRDFINNRSVKKTVIISSNADDGVNLVYVKASDLTVVALLSWGTMKGRLALLRLRGSSENWVWETDFCSQVFEDIATYRGRLCTLDPLGRAFLMDYNSLQMTQLSSPSSFPCEKKDNRLLEDCRLNRQMKVTSVLECMQMSALVPYLV